MLLHSSRRFLIRLSRVTYCESQPTSQRACQNCWCTHRNSGGKGERIIFYKAFPDALFFNLRFTMLSVVPRSRFLGDTGVPLPEFLRDICKFWGTHQFHLIFACKIENSFPEISVHFYLHLSSMSIVLAQEGVQITVK